jgi:hypothetical protein
MSENSPTTGFPGRFRRKICQERELASGTLVFLIWQGLIPTSKEAG